MMQKILYADNEDSDQNVRRVILGGTFSHVAVQFFVYFILLFDTILFLFTISKYE